MNFLKRHGEYFRPDAKGYTDDILQAGLYTDEQAAKYRNVDSPPVRIIPVEQMRREAEERLYQAKVDQRAAEMMLALMESDGGERHDSQLTGDVTAMRIDRAMVDDVLSMRDEEIAETNQ